VVSPLDLFPRDFWCWYSESTKTSLTTQPPRVLNFYWLFRRIILKDGSPPSLPRPCSKVSSFFFFYSLFSVNFCQLGPNRRETYIIYLHPSLRAPKRNPTGSPPNLLTPPCFLIPLPSRSIIDLKTELFDKHHPFFLAYLTFAAFTPPSAFFPLCAPAPLAGKRGCVRLPPFSYPYPSSLPQIFLPYASFFLRTSQFQGALALKLNDSFPLPQNSRPPFSPYPFFSASVFISCMK